MLSTRPAADGQAPACTCRLRRHSEARCDVPLTEVVFNGHVIPRGNTVLVDGNHYFAAEAVRGQYLHRAHWPASPPSPGAPTCAGHRGGCWNETPLTCRT